VITRNVDLSIGSVLGLSAYVVGDSSPQPHFPVLLALSPALLSALSCGVVNGAIVVIARVPSLVVTLAALCHSLGWTPSSSMGSDKPEQHSEQLLSASAMRRSSEYLGYSSSPRRSCS